MAEKRKLNPVWTTSDDETWPTEAEAAVHQRKIDAIRVHESARKELLSAFAGCLKTADGQLFVPGDYYIIRGYPIPQVTRLSMLGAYWQEYDFCSDATLGLVYRYGDKRDDTWTLRVADLYKSEKAAYAALAIQLSERLEQYGQELAEVQAKAK